MIYNESVKKMQEIMHERREKPMMQDFLHNEAGKTYDTFFTVTGEYPLDLETRQKEVLTESYKRLLVKICGEVEDKFNFLFQDLEEETGNPKPIDLYAIRAIYKDLLTSLQGE